MKPKILVTREVFDETLAYLAQHCEVDANQEDKPLDAVTLARRLADKDGMMCCLTDRIDAALIAACPRLKVVANIAVGYNNIDVAACTARGVMATNTPGVLDDSTADLAWALMLATARRITEVESYVRAGEWTGWRLKQWLGVDVHHATLGIIGMGRIGQAVALRASGFRMSVIYAGRHPVPIPSGLTWEWQPFDTVLATSDFLSLHVPLTDATRHLIGRRELALMKPTAYLINTSRGPVIDEAALVSALEARTIAAVGLDVYEREPTVSAGLISLPNAVLLPHVGSATLETRVRMGLICLGNIAAVLEGRPAPNRVNEG
jgi:lactate dehydrogenase-like 2-hydroxyacid dehydrogenase